MRRRSPVPLALTPAAGGAWLRNALTMWEIAFAAPQVIAHRTSRMALAGPSPSAKDRREFVRMGAEKTEAFGESMLAMGLRLMQAQTAMATSMWAQWLKPPSFSRTLPGVVASGLKPVHRRVTANARRLGGTASAGSRKRRTG